MFGFRGCNCFPQPRGIFRGFHQTIRKVHSFPFWRANRLAQDELLDRHAGKRRQGFDLAMLLRFDFNRESVHAHKIVNFDNFVKLEFSSNSFSQRHSSPISRGTANESRLILVPAARNTRLSFIGKSPTVAIASASSV